MRFVNNGLKNPDEEMQKIITDNNLYQTKKLIEFISKKLKEIGWKEDPFSRMFKKLRHFNNNAIIIVQTAKSIPKDLKRNICDCVIFPGLSNEDFYKLIMESSLSCFDADEEWNE